MHLCCQRKVCIVLQSVEVYGENVLYDFPPKLNFTQHEASVFFLVSPKVGRCRNVMGSETAGAEIRCLMCFGVLSQHAVAGRGHQNSTTEGMPKTGLDKHAEARYRNSPTHSLVRQSVLHLLVFNFLLLPSFTFLFVIPLITDITSNVYKKTTTCDF